MYKIVLVAASLIPIVLANGYEEHGHSGGDSHGYEKHDTHVSFGLDTLPVEIHISNVM